MLSRLREKILEKGVVYGTWVTIANPEIVEALSYLPLDWILIDMEHAPLTIGDVEHMLMAVRREDLIALVRVPGKEPNAIKRVLDVGAHGIMVPHVNSGEEALMVVKASRYPPEGFRGVGPRRCARYGLMDLREYYEKVSRDIIVIVQVETGEAVKNIEDIVSVEGVNGIFVGPMDLTASLGIFAEFSNTKYVEALKNVASTSRKAGKITGIMAHSAEDALDKVSLGFNFIALSSDIHHLIEGYKGDLRRLGLNV